MKLSGTHAGAIARGLKTPIYLSFDVFYLFPYKMQKLCLVTLIKCCRLFNLCSLIIHCSSYKGCRMNFFFYVVVKCVEIGLQKIRNFSCVLMK